MGNRSPSTVREKPANPRRVNGTRRANLSTSAEHGASGQKLRPRRRKRVRLRYLMQAWGVSLVVHVVILSALAAATFTSPDTDQEDYQF